MKNLSLERSTVWIAIISFWLLTLSMCSGAFAQASWTNIGNGLQTRVVSGFREYRFVAISGYLPYGVTDSLTKKLNVADSVKKYVTPSMLNSAISGAAVPDATTTVKGKLKLAGDISGTADLPTVPGLADKVPITQKGVINGVATLGADGKVPLSQINDALIGSVNYQGTYNIATNTPPLPAVDPSNKGWYYLVTDAKTVFQGDSVFAGDWVISNGIEWNSLAQNRPETDPVYNSQKSTLAKTDGSNTTGTWPVSITGNAGTASNSTRWDGQFYDAGSSDNNVTSLMTYNANTNLWSKSALGTINPLQWNGQFYDTSTSDNNLSSIMGYNVNTNLWSKTSLADLKARLGISDGSTLNNNVSGTATNLTGLTASISNLNSVTGILGTNAYTSTAYAPLASPALTGAPTAPTAIAGTNTTQIATTAFVQNMAASVPTIDFGTYTPTATALSNVNTPVIETTHYQRIGSQVTVFGKISVTEDAEGSCSLELSLPIASDFTTSQDLSGVGNTFWSDTNTNNITVSGSVANNTARLTFTTSVNTNSVTAYYSYMYTIK